jgi:potassium-transporting ATPase KdpC subunit
MIRRQLLTALIVLIVLSVICGVIYPLVVTGVAQVALGGLANGSLIQKGGKTYGSKLIGQPFSDPKYFWGRLSATSPSPYNAAASSGSNYGPLNPALLEAVDGRIKALKAYDPDNSLPIPVDLVTYSGSGLDPDISQAAAIFQSHRVAKYRGLSDNQVREMIDRVTEGRQLGILGEPAVNVLKLNLALDGMQ